MESEQNVRAIMNTAVDAIITTEAKGTILSFNPAAESMFGYEAGAAVGRGVACGSSTHAAMSSTRIAGSMIRLSRFKEIT